MDGVADGGKVIAAAVHEHIENAGVHSGDATLLLPPQDISAYTRSRVEEMTRLIAKELEISGPFNVQVGRAGGWVAQAAGGTKQM